MRIALLADIHGNSLALDAVLADIERRGGVNGYWLLGDYCAIGYDPSGVVERLQALPNTVSIRGNADRYVATGDRPAPSYEMTRENLDLIPTLAEVHGSFGWTCGHLSARGLLDWLREIDPNHHLTLPDGTRVLLTHASPGSDDGRGLNHSLSDDEFRALTAGANADLICVGHFHTAMDRTTDGLRAINPGSISNSLTADVRAAYAILTAGETGYKVAYHRVSYDHAAALEATRRCGIPGMDYACRGLSGQIAARWMARWDGVTHSPPITP